MKSLLLTIAYLVCVMVVATLLVVEVNISPIIHAILVIIFGIAAIIFYGFAYKFSKQ